MMSGPASGTTVWYGMCCAPSCAPGNCAREQVLQLRAAEWFEARGRIESWRKWSFPFGPLGPDNAGPPSWVVVHKRRRMSRFRLVGGQLMADAAARPPGETWWSLGFEATGPAGLLSSTLESTVALMFAEALPGDVELDMNHCQSHAEWLSAAPDNRRNSPAGG